MDMDSITTVLKHLTFYLEKILSFIFFLLGLTLIGLGTYLLIDEKHCLDFLRSGKDIIPFIFIGIGNNPFN